MRQETRPDDDEALPLQPGTRPDLPPGPALPRGVTGESPLGGSSAVRIIAPGASLCSIQDRAGRRENPAQPLDVSQDSAGEAFPRREGEGAEPAPGDLARQARALIAHIQGLSATAAERGSEAEAALTTGLVEATTRMLEALAPQEQGEKGPLPLGKMLGEWQKLPPATRASLAASIGQPFANQEGRSRLEAFLGLGRATQQATRSQDTFSGPFQATDCLLTLFEGVVDTMGQEPFWQDHQMAARLGLAMSDVFHHGDVLASPPDPKNTAAFMATMNLLFPQLKDAALPQLPVESPHTPGQPVTLVADLFRAAGALMALEDPEKFETASRIGTEMARIMGKAHQTDRVTPLDVRDFLTEEQDRLNIEAETLRNPRNADQLRHLQETQPHLYPCEQESLRIAWEIAGALSVPNYAELKGSLWRLGEGRKSAQGAQPPSLEGVPADILEGLASVVRRGAEAEFPQQPVVAPLRVSIDQSMQAVFGNIAGMQVFGLSEPRENGTLLEGIACTRLVPVEQLTSGSLVIVALPGDRQSKLYRFTATGASQIVLTPLGPREGNVRAVLLAKSAIAALSQVEWVAGEWLEAHRNQEPVIVPINPKRARAMPAQVGPRTRR